MAEGYGPIANQRTRGTTSIQLTNGDKKTLPAGAFVKCVRKEYLSRYHAFADYNENLYVAAYTQFGMALLEKCDLDWSVY